MVTIFIRYQLNMKKVIAFQIAEFIDIKIFRRKYTDNEVYYSSAEVLYVNQQNQYLYILAYGVVCFIGYDEVKMTEIIDYIKSLSKNILNEKLREEFIIHTDTQKDALYYNEIHITKQDEKILRLIMLNVAQSVALDYFSNQAEELLEETTKFTLQLEKYGKLKISINTLKKFIGKVLNVKNRIANNLYILDSPEETWEDEYIDKIDEGLRKTFDVKVRFREIDYQLQIIKNNLDLFKDIVQHRNSNFLEWIIIILILVEVVNMFIEKLF